MKNKDKTKKIAEILEENKIGDLITDMFILQEMDGLVEDISDRKLQIKLEDFFDSLIKDLGERDVEEEVKVEFCCSSCHNIFPLSQKATGHQFSDMCLNCDKEEQEFDEDEDY